MPRTSPGETRAKIQHFVFHCILRGQPPSVREVQDAFGFRSSATARQHLDALVDAGLLEQDAGRDRGYRIPGADLPGLVPLLGRVQAGSLNAAVELASAYVPVRAEQAETTFALTVVGESMAGREIHDGDTVLVERGATVRPGDVVVALIGDEATIKTFSRNNGQIVLKAENPAFADIIPLANGPPFSVIGRVIEVRRQL